jgi:hypothetical protein
VTELHFPQTQDGPGNGPMLFQVDGAARMIDIEKAYGLDTHPRET